MLIASKTRTTDSRARSTSIPREVYGWKAGLRSAAISFFDFPKGI
jgi:hypothetical protein